jgi:hypothetical protein
LGSYFVAWEDYAMIDVVQSDAHQMMLLQDMTEYGKTIDFYADTVHH